MKAFGRLSVKLQRDGYRVINMTMSKVWENGLDNSGFYESNHLNYEGAKILARTIGSDAEYEAMTIKCLSVK